MKKHSQDKADQCQFYRHDLCFEHQKVCDHSVKRKFREEDKNDGRPKKQAKVVHSESLPTEKEELCDSIGGSEDPFGFTSAISDSLETFKFKPRIHEKRDLRLFLHIKKRSLLRHLIRELADKKGIKWFVSVQVKFVKPKIDGSDLVSKPHFRSLCMTTVNLHEID